MAVAVGFVLVKAKLLQTQNLEHAPELGSDHRLADGGRSRFPFLPGVTGEHYTQRTRSGDPVECPHETAGIPSPNGMVAAAVKKEVERQSQFRQRHHVGFDEVDQNPGVGRPLPGTLYGGGADVNRGDVETALGQPHGVGPGSAPEFDRPTRADFRVGNAAN
jgi:hypothetical protein